MISVGIEIDFALDAEFQPVDEMNRNNMPTTEGKKLNLN